MVRNLLIVLGSIVAVLPYLGFPHRIDDVLYSIAGSFIVLLVLFARRKSPKRHRESLHREEIVSTPHVQEDEMPMVAQSESHVPVRYEEDTALHYPQISHSPMSAYSSDVISHDEAPQVSVREESEYQEEDTTPRPRKRRKSIAESLLGDDVPPAHVPLSSGYQEHYVEEEVTPIAKSSPRRAGRPRKIKSEELSA